MNQPQVYHVLSHSPPSRLSQSTGCKFFVTTCPVSLVPPQPAPPPLTFPVMVILFFLILTVLGLCFGAQAVSSFGEWASLVLALGLSRARAH